MRLNKRLYKFLLAQSAKCIANRFEDGCFVEFGSYPGGTALELFDIFRRKGILFDTWAGVPHYDKVDAPSELKENQLNKSQKKFVYTVKLRRQQDKKWSPDRRVKQALKKGGLKKLCIFVRGDICETVPTYMSDHSDKFIFAHLDCNMHLAAQSSLQSFWPRLETGGMIFCDDYKDPLWPGIEQAVNEYILTQDNLHFFDMNKFEVHNCILLKGSEEDKLWLSEQIAKWIEEWQK